MDGLHDRCSYPQCRSLGCGVAPAPRREHGNSLEGELKELLRQEAMRPKMELAEELNRLRGELREKYGMFSDSAALIHEDRDARG